MKERSLHSLFSRLVIWAAPLAAQTGCGGAATVDKGGTGQGWAALLPPGRDVSGAYCPRFAGKRRDGAHRLRGNPPRGAQPLIAAVARATTRPQRPCPCCSCTASRGAPPASGNRKPSGVGVCQPSWATHRTPSAVVVRFALGDSVISAGVASSCDRALRGSASTPAAVGMRGRNLLLNNNWGAGQVEDRVMPGSVVGPGNLHHG